MFRKRSHVRSRALTLGIGVLAAFLTWDRIRKSRRFARDEGELDSVRRPMTHNIAVNVGDQVFLEDGGEEIGAVRKVERDHLVVYIEAAGDFVIRGPEIKAVHYGKVVLSPELVDPRLLEAARTAHQDETD